MDISPQRRDEILDALRKGTVPGSRLDAFAVGIDHLQVHMDEELRKVQSGGSYFKAVRGEYGCGKTFFARWLAERARQLGFVTAEVQVSETETPLHRLETVYRRLTERMMTPGGESGGFRNLIDGWFFTLEEDVLAVAGVDESEAFVGESLDRTFSHGGLLCELADRVQETFSQCFRRARPCLGSLRAIVHS
mgnify:CR=1 FL=1